MVSTIRLVDLYVIIVIAKVGERMIKGKRVTDARKYSDASQYRMSRDQQILSVIGGFLLLPI